jgi:hypothetical protein
MRHAVNLDVHERRRQQTADMLREALEEAERGEIIGVAMVLLEPGGSMTRHRVTQWDHTILAGALSFLLSRICTQGWDDD